MQHHRPPKPTAKGTPFPTYLLLSGHLILSTQQEPSTTALTAATGSPPQ